ncbi:MAG TPA: oxidoreductase [Planctomycetaceae bacterium]|jgi:coenzyme F420-reducing hydrogenase gamma subunit|nr:oxidoreductase [Planctomycetaceae bacterium]
MPRKPRVAVLKFASCDGCQLSLLDAEDELLALCANFEFVHFAEASSVLHPGPYDIAIVEGSITTAEDAGRIRRVRADSRVLITVGACATAGGIQALRAWGDSQAWVQSIYPSPEYIHTLASSTPIAAHVLVDYELHGCPINVRQLIEVLTSFAAGRRPHIPTHAVCLDCKRRGTVCVMVAQGMACLGPITQAGCEALCPTYNRGCYGCFGPVPGANPSALLHECRRHGHSNEELIPLLRNFNATAPTFRAACDDLAKEPWTPA